MNDKETIELIQIIRATYPGEPLSTMALGGGLYALRLESIDRHGKIVWNRADWEQTYLGIVPVQKAEVEA